ncbi:DUF6062 family protein [Thermococcus sp.]|uniref:DUF6062 family protein n=1 Tax=Thermococcus sp. TaxID=35749 RepID=UPI002612FF23|nr:DUF6062 family protein [Thermococcus sp.]
MRMDLIGFHIKGAFGEGCPVCRLLKEYEEDEIDTILYEHVNDPHVRAKFKESLGLCTYHAWRTVNKAYSEPLLGPLGVSIIYEHMLSVYIASLEEGKSAGTGECFLCSLIREKEKTTVEAFAERIDELLPDYERSGSILCRRHYDMIHSILMEKSPEMAEELKRVQIKKLRELNERMKSFIDKFDYRAKEGHTSDEIRALPQAVETLKGLEVIEPLEKEKKEKRRGFPWR